MATTATTADISHGLVNERQFYWLKLPMATKSDFNIKNYGKNDTSKRTSNIIISSYYKKKKMS